MEIKMQATREFTTRAVFSVLTKRMYGEKGMGDVYEVLDFVRDYEHQTIELMGGADVCRNFIYSELPKDLKAEFDNWEHTDNWLEKFDAMETKSVTLRQMKSWAPSQSI